MGNTSTDARKAAAKILHAHLSKLVEETGNEEVLIITREYNVILDAMLEFAQSLYATLDEREVSIIFKNPEGITKTLDTHLMDLLNKMPDDFYEELEDGCTSASCNNESQNFCDCGGQFEDYEIYDVVMKSLSEQPECVLFSCESCGKKFDWDTMTEGADSQYFCQGCWDELSANDEFMGREQPETKPTESEQAGNKKT